jgi:hypothetical protein
VRLPLALLTVGILLAMAGSASAVLPTGNIVVNGDAEAGPAATNATDAPAPAGWQQLPNFTAVAYGSGGAFPSTSIAGPIGGGRNFFAGGPDSGFGPASAIFQDIDLSGAAPEIDAGDITATLSADLGGSGTQGDQASVVAVYDDAAGTTGAGSALQPVTPDDRNGVTGFVHRTNCVAIPPGVRTAHVQVTAERKSGTYNDGYADNVSIRLSGPPCPSAFPPPSPPQPGATANATPTRGRILVKQPGSNRFQELTDAGSIPVGSEVDALRGEVQLQTAANASGKTQQGRFSGGQFVMQQPVRSTRNLLTDLIMVGGRLNKCSRAKVGAAARRPGRRLFGNGRGRFRTRGRFASATVRGTKWKVVDKCKSTTVSVSRGSVDVRDFAKGRTIHLKAPRSYTARALRR